VPVQPEILLCDRFPELLSQDQLHHLGVVLHRRPEEPQLAESGACYFFHQNNFHRGKWGNYHWHNHLRDAEPLHLMFHLIYNYRRDKFDLLGA
jgi:hypothetical protein